MRSFSRTLRARLARPLPGVEAQARMAPRPRTGPEPGADLSALRPAAALLLVYPHEDRWHVPLTVRASGLRSHTGQVSLPGGRVDPGEAIEAAAVREAFEEIGVPVEGVEVIGRLTPLPVWVSHHLLHPVVGVVPARPDFQVHAHEVERLIEIPLDRLRSSDAVRWEERERTHPPLGSMDVPYFDVPGGRVWGATAMILAEFLAVVSDLD